MRLTELWKSKDKPTLSFELFPARTEKAAAGLEKVIDELAALKPDFVSVTFGAGGSTRDGSRQLVEKLKAKGLEVIAYFAGYGLGPDYMTSVLDAYRDLGVETILVVRGDAPKEMEGFTPHAQSLPHASDMISFIKERYDFCLGAAAYPEGHIEAESKAGDLKYLQMKIDNGAEFLITNYCYDNRYFFDFVKICRDLGMKVPLLPGVMPIYSVKMMNFLADLCGATITDHIKEGLAALPPDDNQAVAEFGIELAAAQCRELLQAGAPGVHIYTMDRSRASVRIVRRLKEEGVL